MSDAKFLEPVSCPVCGKLYIKPNNSIYKVRVHDKKVQVCSWTCYESLRKSVKQNKE